MDYCSILKDPFNDMNMVLINYNYGVVAVNTLVVEFS